MRACKTAAQERETIAKECAALRAAFKETDSPDQDSVRHRNVAKLMFIHMLGYPTHFGQMECVKLIASGNYPDKRIGYLALMVLLDERQEVLMLVTNSMKNDLLSSNQFIVGLSLTALGNISSAEMARDLAPEVEKLLGSKNSFIRKKAALASVRVLKKVPELVEDFLAPAAKLLEDRHHGVLISAVTLVTEMCESFPETADFFRSKVAVLVRVLKNLVGSSFSAEHDVGGLNDPFLQVKVLRLLRILGHGDADASDLMSDILAQVATNTNTSKNAGNAVLYECVQTIMGVESISGLRVLAINVLGKFLQKTDNNIRYVALNTLAKVVSVDTQAVQRHRSMIVGCVKDSDVSIRRRALELVYALVNENNITVLAKELIDYLVVSDSEFRPDLANKIGTLVERFAPEKRWHLDTARHLLEQAGEHVSESTCRSVIVLVTNAPELQGYAARTFYSTMAKVLPGGAASDEEKKAAKNDNLLQVAMWIVGEFGELLLTREGELEDEEPITVTDGDVVDSLEAVLRDPVLLAETRVYALTALIKLSGRMPGQASRCEALIAEFKRYVDLEVQSRACEYAKIFQHQGIVPQLLERMPPLDAAAWAAKRDGGLQDAAASGAGAVAGAVAGQTAPGGAAAGGGDLLGDLLDMGAGDAGAAAVAQGAGGDALADLLGGVSMDQPASGVAAPSAPVDPLAALMGGVAPAPAAPAAPSAPADPLAALMGGMAPAPAPAMGGAGTDMLGGLGGGMPAMPATAPAAAAPSAAPFTAFAEGGLTVAFSCTKPDPSNPGVTRVAATYTNSNAVPMMNFSLQAAVPKFMQLKLEPASAQFVPASGSGAPTTQVLTVTNTMHGQKPLVMKLKIGYSLNGAPAAHQAQVSFPAGV